MSRLVRQFLLSSLVAWHAAVMFCGPCLHELAGSSHGISTMSSKGHLPAGPAQSSRDATDGCLICHFVAQGQLPVTTFNEPSIQQIDELAIPSLPLAQPSQTRFHPARAPRQGSTSNLS